MGRLRMTNHNPPGFWFWFSRRRLTIFLFLLWMIGITSANSCSSVCSCLGSFVDCSYRKLTEIPDDLPVWTEVLHLQHNFISNLSKESLRNLTNLEELDLSNNFLSNTVDLLNQLALSLKKLRVSGNRILEVRVPKSFPKLVQLNLKSNDIYQIKGLEMAKNLDFLDLSDNQLKNLTCSAVNVTQWPSSLTRLKLNQNRITKIGKETFKGLGNLQALDLSANHITDLEGLAFNGLSNLLSLSLEDNEIKSPNDGAFWGLSALKSLTLRNNQIQSVRKGWLYGFDSLQVLNVTSNKIERIEDGCWEFAKDISQIDLSMNALTMVNKITFSQAGNLVFLNLSSNQITHVADDSLKHLRRLHTLDLSGNHIGHILESSNSAFGFLKSLQVLRLRNIGATVLPGYTFSGLKHLHLLDLSSNAITGVEPDVFRGLPSLQTFLVQTNAFVCDCDVTGFLHLIQTKPFPDASFICAFPPELRGKELKSLTPSQLKCFDKIRPKIQRDPENLVATAGSNATLQCVAQFTTDSTAQVIWKKDDAPIVNAQVKLSVQSAGNLSIYASNLTLSGLERSNAGSYQCVASNNFGSVYSAKAKLVVHVFPTFVKHPQNISVKIGATAVLECSATGFPRPQVRWKKDGGTNFPAAVQRRFRYEAGSDIVSIVNVSKEDAGMYSCVAQNSAGAAVANITFHAGEGMESLISDPSVRTLSVGATAVFECIQPTWRHVQWLKNGQLLFPMNRHFVLSDGQQLIVSELTENDAGLYQCENMETNDMGTVYTLKITRKRTWWGLDENVTWWIIIAASVICTVIITSLVCLIIFYCCRRKVSRGVSSIGTDETILPDECNPINGLHPSDTSLNSPVTDCGEYRYMVTGSVEDEYSINYPASERQSCLYNKIIFDESSSESPSFTSYATVKPRMNKAYAASPNRTFNTMPRLTR